MGLEIEAKFWVPELEAFRAKVTTGSTEVFESWRERDHDDLVLALALALYAATRGTATVLTF